MKSLLHYLPSVLILFFLISCQENEPDDPVFVKPQPVNSQEVNLIIDESLDFSNYEAHTLLDSVSLDNLKEKLYAPDGFASEVIILDKNTGEIMAVGQLDQNNKTVIFSPETITESLLSLAPMYYSLDDQQKSDFPDRVKANNTFTSLLETVKSILNNKEPIYSDRPEFTKQILAINQFILEEYFPDFSPEGGRLLLGNEGFSDFIRDEQGLAIYNQVSSYVNVEFKSLTDSDYSKNVVLEPRPLYRANGVKQSPLINDDYYQVSINQSNSEVFKQNKDELVFKGIETLLSTLIGKVSGSGLRGCAFEISSDLVIDQAKLVSESGGSPKISNILLFILKGTTDATVKAIKENKCDGLAGLILNKRVILKSIASKSNVLANLYSAANFVYSVSEFAGYAVSLIPQTQIDLEEILQKYNGNPIPAALEVTDINNFNSEYQPGDKVIVKVKMNAKSFYDEWKKAGYEVSWSLAPENGQLDELFSKTDDEGIATIQWTLPYQDNAVVNLTAEVKDQEGDQFYGSPLSFQLKLGEKVDSDAIYREAFLGTWKAEIYQERLANGTYYITARFQNCSDVVAQENAWDNVFFSFKTNDELVLKTDEYLKSYNVDFVDLIDCVINSSSTETFTYLNNTYPFSYNVINGEFIDLDNGIAANPARYSYMFINPNELHLIKNGTLIHKLIKQ